MDRRFGRYLAVFLMCSILLVPRAIAYHAFYEKTPTEAIQVKTLPPGRFLETPVDLARFPASALLALKNLLDYLKQQHIKPQIPVPLDYEQGRMRLYVPPCTRVLPDTTQIEMKELPQRYVLSIGLKGKYNRDTYENGRQRLIAWLSQQQEWVISGPPYVVYWSHPTLPASLKDSEVHIPVRKNARLSLEPLLR